MLAKALKKLTFFHPYSPCDRGKIDNKVATKHVIYKKLANPM